MRRVDGAAPRYFALHKPYMTLCSCSEDGKKQRNTLSSLGLPDGVVNVGRLDRDSEGLLLLTDDGLFCNTVLQGEEHITKRYWCLVAGLPTDETIEEMSKGGLSIRGRITKPCSVRRLDWQHTEATLISCRIHSPPHASTRTASDSTWLEVLLQEGMNRQVSTDGFAKHLLRSALL